MNRPITEVVTRLVTLRVAGQALKGIEVQIALLTMNEIVP
jgi:hypothetical protein